MSANGTDGVGMAWTISTSSGLQLVETVQIYGKEIPITDPMGYLGISLGPCGVTEHQMLLGIATSEHMLIRIW